jgi:hypothetical protein
MEVSDVKIATEVDDDVLFPGEIQTQPVGRPALAVISNRITLAYLDVHTALLPASAPEMAATLPDAVASIKSLLDDDDGGGGALGLTAPFAAEPDPESYLSEEDRRRLRHDVLRADLRASVLACRARLLDHAAAVEGLAGEWQRAAREALYRELAPFLKGLPEWLVEPHAVILVSLLCLLRPVVCSR